MRMRTHECIESRTIHVEVIKDEIVGSIEDVRIRESFSNGRHVVQYDDILDSELKSANVKF